MPAMMQSKENYERFVSKSEHVILEENTGEIELDENFVLIIEEDSIKIKDTELVYDKDIDSLKELLFEVYLTTLISYFVYYILMFILVWAVASIAVQMLFKTRLKFKYLFQTMGFSMVISQITLLSYFVIPRYLIYIELITLGTIFTILVRNIMRDSLFEYMYFSKEYE